MDALLLLIQDSALSSALRRSVWVYPLINAGHILGIGLLIGSVIPMDLRLLGLWDRADPDMLFSVLRPVAMTGLFIALGCGSLLFITQPLDYASNRLFQAKMALLFLALINAASMLLRTSNYLTQSTIAGSRSLSGSALVTASAVISLVLWLAILVCGRLIGYR